jgi:hypothetical protein
MVWWNIDRNDNRITATPYVQPDSSITTRIQVKGYNMFQKLANLGPHAYKCNTLHKKQEYASFVKTDIVHALNWDGKSPRVVLSFKYPDPWSALKPLLSE